MSLPGTVIVEVDVVDHSSHPSAGRRHIYKSQHHQCICDNRRSGRVSKFYSLQLVQKCMGKTRVRDHEHLSESIGKLCIINATQTRDDPCIFHNRGNYDGHLLSRVGSWET
ncbi:hypothetical protein AVEN_143432-1 [Araneus ventricosus]|uniref:Uncharacterized protein n=1 Tax=Araneus ventricosus TaxID=182803 RepID=A0A4Y2QFT0_ARAVE|nr:hypothetical protein AVEN_143432-1 [Araneus ventricosus]